MQRVACRRAAAAIFAGSGKNKNNARSFQTSCVTNSNHGTNEATPTTHIVALKKHRTQPPAPQSLADHVTSTVRLDANTNTTLTRTQITPQYARLPDTEYPKLETLLAREPSFIPANLNRLPSSRRNSALGHSRTARPSRALLLPAAGWRTAL